MDAADRPDRARRFDIGAEAGARGRGDGWRGLLQAAALHRAADDRRRVDRRVADPLDGRDPLLRHHHQHHQRRAGGRDQDRPHPPLRDRVPVLRPRLRGRHRPLHARRHDHHGQPVHARPQAKGAGEVKSARGGAGSRIGIPMVLGVILVWTLVPLLWMLMSSFKPAEDLTASTPQLTFTPTLEHYKALFSGGNNIGPYIRNSVIAAGVSTIIAVTLGCLAGYGLARSRFRGKDHVAFWIISQRMAPIAAVLLPLFVIFRFTGLLGSTLGLIVAYLTFNLPFAIWIMNAFFSELSPSLEEAAMIDGATRWSAFRDVTLPLVVPGIATTAILCLVFSWNDYAFAVTFSGPDSQSLPIAASQLVTQTSIDWGQLTAIGTIVVAPMILVGLIVRKWLVTGLTLGAVTGE